MTPGWTHFGAEPFEEMEHDDPCGSSSPPERPAKPLS